MRLNLCLEQLMVASDLVHKDLEYLMSRGALLMGIQHVEQAILAFAFLQKLLPLCLVGDRSRKKLLLDEIAEVDSVGPLLNFLLMDLVLVVFLLGLDDVGREGIDAVEGMQFLVALVIPEHTSELVPFGVMADLLLFQQHLQVLDIALFADPSFLFLLNQQLVHVVLVGVLFVRSLQDPPPWISDKVELDLMHLAV